MTRMGITHVLSVASALEPAFPRDFDYMCIDILDRWGEGRRGDAPFQMVVISPTGTWPWLYVS